MDAELVWKMPYPSSWGSEVSVSMAPDRTFRLYIDDPSGEQVNFRLIFTEVLAYKCTTMRDLTAEQIELAYDRLVACDAKRLGLTSDTHKCYVICFDDGPCYELVARSHDVVQVL